MIFARLLVAAALTALPPQGLSAQEPPAPRSVAIDDQFALKGVGAPVISPDGAWVAYTVSTTDAEAESSSTRLWMTAADGSGEPLPMTREGESAGSPAWSPDGRYLSFLASRGEDARTQVWVLDRRGGEAWALTEVKQGVSDYAWSPNGSRLALVIRDEAEEDSTWTSDEPEPWVVDRLQFKRDGAGYLTDSRKRHLYVFDVATRALRQITAGDHDEGGPVWSPDGTRIAFTSNRTPDPDTNSNTDIWVVDADAAEPVTEPFRVTTNPGSDGSPAWSPDGARITYATVVRPDLIWYATTHLAVVDADGTDARVLTEAMDRNVSSPRFSPDGRLIYFGVEDSAENQVAAYDLRADAVRRVTAGPMSVGGMDLNAAGDMVVRVARTDLPGDVFRVRDPAAAGRSADRTAELVRLTAVNDSLLGTLALGEVREERWESEPGVTVEGFVHLPPDYEAGRRYPLLLRPHGGPVSQYSHSFNFEAHLFAANGYVVLTPNPRGSSGYGQDFSAVLWADWGNPDFKDVMAGVDHLIARGIADGDRMGVGGWSYGGILTNYVITQTDRFKGAITGASEVLYIANYGHDHYQLQWEAELGLPWEGNNRDSWERISPFNKVDRVTTPTLVMGGEKDWNVPIQNSEQLYQALRRRGIPTQLVVYPGQPHGIGPVSYRRDRHQRYLEWYERWVKGSGTRPVS
ncbi:MAG TPA: S9 family peptidase [Longimicrobiales bacterium]|nr:S9 family peptidase [Longimicrobiales bacterium]